MRGVLPVLIVFLGLSAREYVDRNVPGGLAHADAAAVVALFQESADVGLERAFRSHSERHRSRSVRHRRSRRIRHVDQHRQRETIRTRIRVGDERVTIYRRQKAAQRRELARERARMRCNNQLDRYSESDQPVEVTFVVPAEREDMFDAQRKRRGIRRNR